MYNVFIEIHTQCGVEWEGAEVIPHGDVAAVHGRCQPRHQRRDIPLQYLYEVIVIFGRKYSSENFPTKSPYFLWKKFQVYITNSNKHKTSKTAKSISNFTW